VPAPTVYDDQAGSRFTLEEDGHEAELVYELDGDRLVLVHTGVPDELGGRGLGGVLVKSALQRATAEGLTVVPRCPFARSWLEKHPDDVGAVPVEWPAAR
jgi:uncharacterized protein